MIGVLASPGHAATIAEFFELFKTPWEPYRFGRTYDVVVTTVDEVPDVDASVLIVYRSGPTTLDRKRDIRVTARGKGAMLDLQAVRLPIYGVLGTLDVSAGSRALLIAPVGAVAIELPSPGPRIVRVGYDLFDEVAYLLSAGQPVECSELPTLDSHIALLRNFIVRAGVPLLEIPPAPAGHTFAVCLTHDIDFVGIRQHLFDRSMWGFVYRSSAGAIVDLCKRRISIGRLWQRWRALASLPLVYLGFVKDFWEPFDWYLRVEANHPATYFLIPFKRRAGEKVGGRRGAMRATAYDVDDIKESAARLTKAGCELAVHGIDAWHSVASGRDELNRIAAATGSASKGVRMHWLLWDDRTPAVLERAGYSYDSTAGYNETIGYRNGTGQVFRPVGAASLLELPLHVQDGALFYPRQLDLTEREAELRCQPLIEHARATGGVLTLLWHDRSHGPERFWGEFYERLVRRVEAEQPWFATAAEIVGWFRKRRDVRFGAIEGLGDVRTCLQYDGDAISPPLMVRLHNPGAADRNGFAPESTPPTFVDAAWNGRAREFCGELVSHGGVGAL